MNESHYPTSQELATFRRGIAPLPDWQRIQVFHGGEGAYQHERVHGIGFSWSGDNEFGYGLASNSEFRSRAARMRSAYAEMHAPGGSRYVR